MTRKLTGSGKSPITALLLAISIISTITGAATTPLMTALQNKALIGSIGLKLSKTPISVAAAMQP